MSDYQSDRPGSEPGRVTEPYGGPATATEVPPPPPPPPTTAVGAATPEPHGHGHRQGVGFATALIFIGALLLIAQLVPGLAWWNLWPLVIIAAGLVQAVTPGREGWNVYRFFDGLVTVAFGLVFLAITLGIIGWGIWWRILGLWPVLLIAIGFDLLGKSMRSSWLRVIGSLAIIAALAYAVAGDVSGVRAVGFANGGQVRQVSFDEPVRGAESATLELSAGVADLEITSGDELITARGTTPFGEPELSVDRSGDTAEVSVRLGDGDGTVAMPGGADAEVDMTLSDEVVWDARIETGLSTLRADFRDVRIGALLLKPGVADCTVTLGDAEDDGGRVSIKSGISTVTLRVPRDAEVRVESDSGLSATDIDDRLDSLGDGVWQTPGFSAAQEGGDPVWVVDLESGLGTFDLSTY